MASPRKSRKTSIISSDGEGGSGMSGCDVDEQDVETLEDARRLIRDLKDRCASQAQQLMLWRRRVKIQDEQALRTQQQRSDQLKTLSSQLLLFEARLIRKQKDISHLLSQRDVLIARQQQALQLQQNRLLEAGIESPLPDLSSFVLDSPTGDTNLDSLNDSDSAVVLEDGLDHELAPLRFRSGSDSVTIVRSVSDAVEPGGKYYLRRSNGFLRRPEVLETVYSVEEDAEGDGAPATAPVMHSERKTEVESPEMRPGSLSEGTTPLSSKRLSWSSSGRLQALYGSFERLSDVPDKLTKVEEQPANHVTTYNRVMSNHRSVTKPKDVKYKRINKAKSKSLEELRGRLRNWVDKGNKGVLTMGHSEA